jgi:hypothetical protein
MADLFENLLIMILTIVVLLGGGYLALVVLAWGLKIKSGSSEQEGLAKLWSASQPGNPKSEFTDDEFR